MPLLSIWLQLVNQVKLYCDVTKMSAWACEARRDKTISIDPKGFMVKGVGFTLSQFRAY